MNSALAMLPGGFQIGEIGTVDFGQIGNPFADALSGAIGDRNAAVQTALSQDYLGNFGTAIAAGASGAAEKLRELAGSFAGVEDAAGKAGGAAERAAKKAKDPWDGLRETTKEVSSAFLEAGRSTGGILKGLVDGTLSWRDALTQALSVALKLMTSINPNLFGGGFFQGLLGGLLGFASGGYTGNGSTSAAAGIVHGREYVFNAKATARIGRSNLDAIHKAANGYKGGGYVAPVRVNDSDGTCEIPFTVIPDVLKTPWNPATDEVAPPPVLEEFEFESNLDTPAKPSQAIMVQMNSGQREARVKFAPVPGAVTAEANYRTYTDGLPDQWASMTEAGRISAYVAQNLTGQKVDFRVRFANNDGEVSYFSEFLEVASLAMDNSQPAPPTSVVAIGHTDPQTGNVTSWTITVKGNALQAVRVEVGSDAGVNSFFQDFHPGDDNVFGIDATQIAGTIRARLLSSNGTPSSWTDATIS